MKKFLIFTLSIVCIICVLALVACNDTSDPASKNAEFVEYRKQVVAVLNDNGIKINDYDNVLDSGKAKMANLFGANVAYAAEKSVADIMTNDEYSVEAEDYQLTYDQMYGLSLRYSLFVGDGMSTYFKEKKFYDITCYIGGIYMKVSKEGNSSVVRAYSDYGDDVTYDLITLDFNSVNNYTFTSVEWHDDGHCLISQGNHNKELVAVSMHSSQTGGGEVLYSPNGIDFYQSSDDEVVEACYAIVKGEIPSSTSQFTALKNEVKYTFTDKQIDELSDKYFKDIASEVAPEREGIQFEQMGSYNVATAYFVSEGESDVVIPSNVQYLSATFAIVDLKHSAQTLTIPSSVKGIVGQGDVKQGEADYVVVTPDQLRIDHMDSAGELAPLKSVTVESGSTLYNAGTGHLFTLDGLLTYVTTTPFDYFDLNWVVQDNAVLSQQLQKNTNSYKTTFSKITSIDFKLDCTPQQFDDRYRAFEGLLENYQQLFTAWNTVNVYTYADYFDTVGAHDSVTFTMFDDIDLTYNLSLECAGVTLSLVTFKNNIELNIIALAKNAEHLLDLYIDNGTHLTLNLFCSAKDYNTYYFNAFNFGNKYIENPDLVTFNFASGGEAYDELIAAGFEAATSLYGGVAIRPRKNSGVYTVPEEFDGEPITELHIDAKNMDFQSDVLTITLSANVNKIVAYDSRENGELYEFQPNLTFIYNGTWAEFLDSVEMVFTNRAELTLHATDKTVLYDVIQSAGTPHTMTFNMFGDVTVRYVNYQQQLEIDSYTQDEGYAYFVFDDEGAQADVQYIPAPTRDITYTLYRFYLGTPNGDGSYSYSYEITFKDITMTLALTISKSDNSNYEWACHGELSRERWRIEAELFDPFDVFTIAVEDKDDPYARMDPYYVHFVWSYSDDGTMTIVGLEEVE